MLALQDQLERQRSHGSRTGGCFRSIFRARPRHRGAKNDDHERNAGQGAFMHEGLLYVRLWLSRWLLRDVELLRRLVFCQRRNPPTNAFRLSPALQPGGNFFRFLTFPPPRTTSSGSSAAIRRAITSLTICSHFFCPKRLRPAI